MNTMHDLVSTCKQIQFNYYTKKTSRAILLSHCGY